MPSSILEAGRRSAEHYSENRATMLNEAYKVLVLILGGAIIALLAFLQDSWGEQPALSKVIVSGTWWFVIGLGFATLIPLLRYYGSYYLEKTETAQRESEDPEYANVTETKLRDAERYDGYRKWFRKGFLACFFLAMACFVVGAAVILCDAGNLLPT